MNEEIELIRGSGNIYRDFNLPDAEVRQAKVLLASEIIGILDARGLSTRKAAEETGVHQSEFARLRKPDLKRFTIDRLISILNKLDRDVELSFTVSKRKSKSTETVHA